MFYIIPYINYEVKTLHKKEMIIERFYNSVHIVQMLSFVKPNSYKEYEGVLYNDGFKFRKILRFGFSAFLPILSCEMYEEDQNVRLKVNIQFHKYVIIGLLAFFLFQIVFLTLDFGSFANLIIPFFIVIYLFNSEVRSLKEKLNEIIQ